MKKLLSASVLALMLVGCGGSDGGSNVAPTPTPEQPVTPVEQTSLYGVYGGNATTGRNILFAFDEGENGQANKVWAIVFNEAGDDVDTLITGLYSVRNKTDLTITDAVERELVDSIRRDQSGKPVSITHAIVNAEKDVSGQFNYVNKPQPQNAEFTAKFINSGINEKFTLNDVSDEEFVGEYISEYSDGFESFELKFNANGTFSGMASNVCNFTGKYHLAKSQTYLKIDSIAFAPNTPSECKSISYGDGVVFYDKNEKIATGLLQETRKGGKATLLALEKKSATNS